MSDPKKTEEIGATRTPLGRFAKGNPGGPRGPKGVTRDVREAIAKIAEGKVDQVSGWLDSVAAEDPAKAMDLYLKMIEYHIPKLARSEMTGPNGGPVQIQAPKLEIVLHRPDAP